jgi:hypothetical protein
MSLARGHGLIGLVLALALAAFGRADDARAQTSPLGLDLAAQIERIQADKAARTPIQRKIGSRLLYAARLDRGQPAVPGLPRLGSGLEVSRGRVELDLLAVVSADLLAGVEALGGRLVSVHPDVDRLRIELPLSRLEDLAAREDVRALRPAARARVGKLDTSEGDVKHGADLLRAGLDVDGGGVTVGVLSDGVDALATLQSSGDLPPGVTVLPGQAGSGSEGTAMLEIVHDLAPGASLTFATAFGGEAGFAANILALRASGADVIVDDVGYFAEAVFQDDLIAQAVASVVADGALYFSSAGNGGSLAKGTSGVWEGDFVDSGSPLSGNTLHDFGGGVGTGNEITLASPFLYSLHWSDPLATSANDYDLYLTNKAGNVVLFASTDVQDGVGGDDDPFEAIGATGQDAGKRLLIGKDPSAAARHLHLNANRGRLSAATDGQLSGHAAVSGAFAVAAVDARLGGLLPFTGFESVQTYSSDGPRRIFYASDGTPITPGDFSATGGEVRAKPDVAAADCVSTATPGFSTFCGTSAAAPHAAAIAALLIEATGRPLDTGELIPILAAGALDIEAAGADVLSGLGLIDALATGTALPECFEDVECDDGSFCTGVEACVAGACVAAAGDPCSAALLLCDEASDACVECLVDADCDDGLFCSGVELCAAGTCLVPSGDPCTGPEPFCDEAADACVDCLLDADCNDGVFCNGPESCSAGVCAAGPGDPCVAGGALCSEPLASCVACLSAPDCDDGLFCNGVETCVAGLCAPDASGDPCSGAGALCDESGDVCVACLTNTDCEPGQLCESGACIVPPPPVPLLTDGGRALFVALMTLLGALALRGAGGAESGRPR